MPKNSIIINGEEIDLDKAALFLAKDVVLQVPFPITAGKIQGMVNVLREQGLIEKESV